MNDITELRELLFATLRQVKTGELDTDRARAINQTAAVIVDTARVEIEDAEALGNDQASPFLLPQQAASEHQVQTGVVRVVQHRMRG